MQCRSVTLQAEHAIKDMHTNSMTNLLQLHASLRKWLHTHASMSGNGTAVTRHIGQTCPEQSLSVTHRTSGIVRIKLKGAGAPNPLAKYNGTAVGQL